MILLSIIVITIVVAEIIAVYKLWDPEPFTDFDELERRTEFGLEKPPLIPYKIYKSFSREGRNMPFWDFVREFYGGPTLLGILNQTNTFKNVFYNK